MEFIQFKSSILWNALSKLGKSIFLPKGIFYWSDRATKEAEINGTIGVMTGYENEIIKTSEEKNVVFYIPRLRQLINKDPSLIVPYAPISGLPDLRKYWKNWIVTKCKTINNLSSKNLDISELITLPVVTHGITFGIFLATRLFAEPEEFIISPNKRWENYDSIIINQCGVKIKSFEFFVEEKNGLKFNFKGLENVIIESFNKLNKAILILNFPHNPTGYVPTIEEANNIVSMLIKIVEEYKKPLVIIFDDAYEGYVYKDNCIMGSLFYEFLSKSKYIIPIKLDGASKEMILYGGRIGFFTLGLHDAWYNKDKKQEFIDEFDNKLGGMIRSTISNCNRINQSILVEMFKANIDNIINERTKIISILKERYELINELLKQVCDNTGKISVDPNAGGFFLIVNLKIKISASQFCDHLLNKYKTGLIPFEDPNENVNGIRIAYSSINKNLIPKLVENIKLALNDF